MRRAIFEAKAIAGETREGREWRGEEKAERLDNVWRSPHAERNPKLDWEKNAGGDHWATSRAGLFSSFVTCAAVFTAVCLQTHSCQGGDVLVEMGSPDDPIDRPNAPEI